MAFFQLSTQQEGPDKLFSSESSEPSHRICGYGVLRRIARILWWTPVVGCPIVFVAIQQLIPDLNGNSIGDGFRKMNAMARVIIPLGIASWSVAFSITAYLDYRLIPGRRLRYWGLAFVLLALLALLCLYTES